MQEDQTVPSAVTVAEEPLASRLFLIVHLIYDELHRIYHDDFLSLSKSQHHKSWRPSYRRDGTMVGNPGLYTAEHQSWVSRSVLISLAVNEQDADSRTRSQKQCIVRPVYLCWLEIPNKLSHVGPKTPWILVTEVFWLQNPCQLEPNRWSAQIPNFVIQRRAPQLLCHDIWWQLATTDKGWNVSTLGYDVGSLQYLAYMSGKFWKTHDFCKIPGVDPPRTTQKGPSSSNI